MTPFERTDKLFELIEQKLQLLLHMRELTTIQSEAILSNDISQVLTTLSRKEVIMDQLNRVQTDLQDYQSDDPETRIWSSPERRAECRDMSQRCGDILCETLTLEQSSMADLSIRRDSLNAQIRQISDVRATQAAYRSQAEQNINAYPQFAVEG